MGTTTILVTGASGFVGRHLIDSLTRQGDVRIRALVRSMPTDALANAWSTAGVQIVTGDLTKPTSLAGLCDGVDTVFHLAGYAHADDSDAPGGGEIHRRTTVGGMRSLLDCAVPAGVRKVVFASSVKACGEGGSTMLSEDCTMPPQSEYGKARLAAENMLLEAARHHGLDTTILRFTLVYGRDNKGNVPRMIAAIDRGFFPPLPEVHNRRSMVHVDDVVQALRLVAQSPAARGQRYIVTDDSPCSTRQMFLWICQALGRRVPRWTVPVALLRVTALVGDIVGTVFPNAVPINSGTLEKLLGSAWYSSAKIRNEIGFCPTRTLTDSIPEMVQAYRERSRRI